MKMFRNSDRISFPTGRIFLGIGLLICLFSLVWWIFGSRNPVPLESYRAAQLAIRYARMNGVHRLAYPEFKSAHELFRQGEIEMYRQGRQLHPFRDYSEADSLFRRCQIEMDRAEEIARMNASRIRGDAVRSFENLVEQLAQWRLQLNNELTNWEAEKLWSLARSAADYSRKLIDSQNYQEAIAAIEDGYRWLDSVSDFNAALDSSSAVRDETWQFWIEETMKTSAKSGGYGIIIDKRAHLLFLLKQGTIIAQYHCDLGYNSSRQKLVSGDGATPEGMYRVVRVIPKGSKYYKALLLDYPNARDRERFIMNKRNNIIPDNANMGGLIEIHGGGGLSRDWTDGCIALSNADMDRLTSLIPAGTPVTIVRRSELH